MNFPSWQPIKFNAFVCQKVNCKFQDSLYSYNLDFNWKRWRLCSWPLLHSPFHWCRASSVEPPTHLPGVIGFQLDGGQCGQAGSKAHPFALDEGDAVEDDAVRQNQSHEGPAHRDQDCQTTVHTKDQGSVLWVKRGQRQCDVMTGVLYYSWYKMQHTTRWC